MTVRLGLIVVASLMISSVAHAEPIPSNAELFGMLKAQQQTISELRAELKQLKQERKAAIAVQRDKVETATEPSGPETSKNAVAVTAPATTTTTTQASAAYNEGAAVPPTLGRGAYIGLFGGGGRGGDSSNSQRGTVFFPEAMGGPLDVNATGRTSSNSVGFIGTQIGYEWAYRSRLMPSLKIDLLPALELEGLKLSRTTHSATLENPTTRLVEQTFDNTYSTNIAVILANAVVGLHTPYQGITPYIGGGIGAARISIEDATSTQVNPLETGINHFNSGTDSSAWTFAAQAKAGLRVALGDSAYVFGEYRYLYIDSVDQTFGSTIYPAHAATSAWTVRSGDTSYNLLDVGIGLNF